MGVLRKLVPGAVAETVWRIRFVRVMDRLRREGRTIPLEDFIDDTDDLTLTSIPEHPWNMQLLEVAVLCFLAKRLAVRNVFEIGTFDGRTAINIARSLPEGGRVTTLNLPEEVYGDDSILHQKGVGYRFKSLPESSKIDQVLVDSTKFEPAVVGRKYDMVLIDGDHTERYVLSDTSLALSLLVEKEESVIVWHDINYPSVRRALHQIEAESGFRYWHIAQTKLAVAFPFSKGAMVLGCEMGVV